MSSATWPYNALSPYVGSALAGDSNYTTASDTDDRDALQALIDAASTSGVPGVVLPGRRTYRIGSPGDSVGITITKPIIIQGVGGLAENGVAGGGPYLVWGGDAGGTMFDVAFSSQNIPSVGFENLTICGRSDLTSPPATLIKYRGTGGAGTGIADTGSFLRNVWLQQCSGVALDLQSGATNFLIDGGRFDNWGTAALKTTGAASVSITGNCTMAMGKAADCMIDLDGSTAFGTILKMYGTHLETDASLNEVYAGGTNPFDKRMLIRMRVNPALSYVQHHVYFDGLELAEPFTDALAVNILSHCLFGIDGTSGDSGIDTSKRVSIAGVMGKGLERGSTDAATDWETRIVGGNIHSTKRPPSFATGNFGIFQYGTGTTGEPIKNWIQTAFT
jgi:hypothetical protein